MERQSMSREIEADGYITRESDLKQTRAKICMTCKHRNGSICNAGRKTFEADWREKYEVCDKWEGASE